MNTSKHYLRFGFIMLISLFLSLSLFAQHGRGHYGNYNRYNHYNHYPRTQVSVNFGPRYGYHPYYGYRPSYRPYYRSPRAFVHYGPAFGIRFNILPSGYSRIYVGSSPYYYNQGVYYRSYDNGGYEVVAPPLGASVSQLPPGAIVTVIDGQKYYQAGGTFYQEEFSDDNRRSYLVVGTDGVINTAVDDQQINDPEQITGERELPVVGNRYDELPSDAKVEIINQQKYYVSGDGVFYREVIEGNKIRYEVTSVE